MFSRILFTRLGGLAIVLALLAPVTAGAQSVVVVTPNSGSVSGTFGVTVAACDPYARGFVWHQIMYANVDVTSEFWGGSIGAPAWCMALGADVMYEEYTAELTAVCGQQPISAAFLDIQNYGGNDGGYLNGGSCKSEEEESQAKDRSSSSVVAKAPEVETARKRPPQH